MPVQIIAEFEKWRKIRDWEGDEGWVHFVLLSSRRTVLVSVSQTTMRRHADESAPAVARLAQGMVARINVCDLEWCFVSVDGYDGWLKRGDLWGLEPGELIQ
jgi:SH3-like domain-containing protein